MSNSKKLERVKGVAMQQEIDFVKFSPTQNMTILVKTNYPVEQHKHIASKMMSYDSVYAEQVGFIKKPINKKASASLQMGGDEFCGNACMALAAFVASKNDLQENKFENILLESSGTDQLVSCHVQKKKEAFYCQISMPVPKEINLRQVMVKNQRLNIVTVSYAGFIHAVIEVAEFSHEQRTLSEDLAKSIAATSKVKLTGVMLYKPNTGEMAPLIYIPQLDSLIWERGCGSGTASLGAYLAWQKKADISAQITQPGGMIKVNATIHNEEITSVDIEGSVKIVAHGTAFIDLESS